MWIMEIPVMTHTVRFMTIVLSSQDNEGESILFIKLFCLQGWNALPSVGMC